MPNNVPEDGPVKLNPIDPSKTGWLVEKWIPNQAPSVAYAPVSQYKGNSAQAFRFFDEELAKAQTNTHLQVNLKFEPLADGITFNLKGDFYDTVSGGSPRITDWAGLPVGSHIGHSSGNIPISINRVCGPFEKLGPDTFRLSFDRSVTGNQNRVELVFAAIHPGDNEYKQAIQQASMMIPVCNSEGSKQLITFPQFLNQKLKTKTLKLNATSDAGLQVYYYVRQGPVEVAGNSLRFTQIPPRSKFPIKVTVIAWQYGRNSEPKIKTAEQVEQTFMIVK